jgi:hypothetical protein
MTTVRESKRFATVYTRNEQNITANCTGVTLLNQSEVDCAVVIDGVPIQIEAGASFGWSNASPINDVTVFDLKIPNGGRLILLKEIVIEKQVC